jgi:hypothetical protein
MPVDIVVVVLVFLMYLEKKYKRFPRLVAVLSIPINRKRRISTAHYIRTMILTSDMWV